MESLSKAATGDERGPDVVQAKAISPVRQGLRYVLHLLAVYAIVRFVTVWIAGWTHGTFLPAIQQHSPTVSSFQFVFSHLFAFSFFPALIVGFVHSEWFRHRVAVFVWIIPAAVLAYKFATFPTSLFQNQFAAAFHEYFAGGFMIPEWHSYEELLRLVAPSPDAMRGMEQLRYTAPAYAAIGYSIGTWLAIRFRISKLDAILRDIKPSWRPPKTG
jgi:hypothetical protein